MIEESISARYARALVDLAKQNNQIDAFASELSVFLEICSKSKLFLPTLTNKGFAPEIRITVLKNVLEKEKFNSLVLNFLKILIKNSRIELIPIIYKKYCEMADQILNRCNMTVFSAVKLEDGQYKALKDCFSEKLKQEMVVTSKIKEDLLGGVRIQIGNKIYDNTLKRQIQDLRKELI